MREFRRVGRARGDLALQARGMRRFCIDVVGLLPDPGARAARESPPEDGDLSGGAVAVCARGGNRGQGGVLPHPHRGGGVKPHLRPESL